MKQSRQTKLNLKSITIDDASEIDLILTPDLYAVTSNTPLNGATEFLLIVTKMGVGDYNPYIIQTQIFLIGETLQSLSRTHIDNKFTGWKTTDFAASTRPERAPGFTMFDTTLGKPIWLKSVDPDVKEVCALTCGAATTAGTLTVTLNKVGTEVEVAALDTADQVATKIKETAFTGWTATVADNVVTFIKDAIGACQAPAFADTDTTGVTGIFEVTTPGSKDIWVDATGTEV